MDENILEGEPIIERVLFDERSISTLIGNSHEVNFGRLDFQCHIVNRLYTEILMYLLYLVFS